MDVQNLLMLHRPVIVCLLLETAPKRAPLMAAAMTSPNMSPRTVCGGCLYAIPLGPLLNKPCKQCSFHESVMQVHCVSAFGKLQDMVQQHGPFPQGLILHSWIGPAEMVDALAKIQGVYFSLSGHLTRMSKKKYEPMVKKAKLDFLLLVHPCCRIFSALSS